MSEGLYASESAWFTEPKSLDFRHLATYNSPSISAELPILMADIFDAFLAIGIEDPTVEQVQELTQYIRDEAGKAALEALKQWKEGKYE
jgi:hypothetical protein